MAHEQRSLAALELLTVQGRAGWTEINPALYQQASELIWKGVPTRGKWAADRRASLEAMAALLEQSAYGGETRG